MGSEAQADARARRWAGPVLVAVVGLGVLSAAWGSWGDPQVDGGREWYVPWRLLEGDVLYRDLAWFNGPLSPWVNAGWFGLLGVSVAAQRTGNLVVLAAILAMAYALLRRLGGSLAATAGCLVFLTVFAPGSYPEYPNYNFLAPYSHELTHGVALCLAALLALSRYQARPSPWAAAAVGICWGAAALTKPEVLVALSAGLAVGGAALAWIDPAGRGRLGRHTLVAGAAALAPILLAWVALARQLPAGDAARGVLGAWVHLAEGRVTSLPFYRSYVLGLEAPGPRLAQGLGRTLLGGLGVAGLAAVALRLGGGTGRGRAGGAALLAGALALGGTWGWTADDWVRWTAPLPLAALLVLAALARELVVARAALDPRGTRLVLALAFLALGLGFLLKLGLRPRFSHYGFALAPLATLGVLLGAVAWLPEWVRRRGGDARVVQAGALAACLALGVGHLKTLGERLEMQRYSLGGDGDAVRIDGRAVVLAPLLEQLGAALRPGQTLWVLPEGAGLNYLLRVPAPVPYLTVLPPEVAMFGEEAIVAAAAAAPPDWVVLLHKDTSEYGVRFFGRDYARGLGAWLQGHYYQEARFGAEPLRGAGFGAVLLARVGRQAPPGDR